MHHGTRNGYLAAAGTVAIWTGFILVSRAGGKSDLTPYDILALRLGTATLALVLFTKPLPAALWRDCRLWLLALIGGVAYGLLAYMAFKTVPAAHGAILLPGLQPFLVALAALLITGRRPNPARLWGFLVIGLGMALTAAPLLRNTPDSGVLEGDLLMLAASASWAVFSVLAKSWSPGPWLLTRFMALASALLYLPVYILVLPKALGQVPAQTLVVQGLYQGLGPTILAMLLYVKAVESLGPARVGALLALVPVLAGLIAVPLLGEPMTPWLAGGLLAVSGGAYLAARPNTLEPGRNPCPTST